MKPKHPEECTCTDGVHEALHDTRARCDELTQYAKEIENGKREALDQLAAVTRERDEWKAYAQNIIPRVIVSIDAIKDPITWAAKMEAERDEARIGEELAVECRDARIAKLEAQVAALSDACRRLIGAIEALAIERAQGPYVNWLAIDASQDAARSVVADTAAAAEAYRQRVRAEAFEEVAKLVEHMNDSITWDDGCSHETIVDECVAAIRARAQQGK